MTTALLAYSAVLKRGREMWLYGTYPVRICHDVSIPVGEDSYTMVLCTNIIAYGFPDELDYADYFLYNDLSFFPFQR